MWTSSDAPEERPWMLAQSMHCIADEAYLHTFGRAFWKEMVGAANMTPAQRHASWASFRAGAKAAM